MKPNHHYFLEQAQASNYSSTEVVKKFSKLFNLSEKQSVKIVELYATQKLPGASKRKRATLIFESVLSILFMILLFIAPVKNPEWPLLLTILVMFGCIPIIQLIRHIYER